MKKMAIALVACCALLRATGEELQWMTDLPKAQAKAKEEKKLVLVDITGSDWCGFCIKLKQEVFSTPEFAEYAKKNFVLVEADFPRHKQLSADQKKANTELKQKYAPDSGYPTIVLLDPSGKKLGQKVGYHPGSGPKDYIEKLEKIANKVT
ncbi:MAG TPA: thioredoxin family protein [Candidatus Eisenbacteria bacterium]|nr:thioredoxin family protein [Candidatus Eisenbacteria bacterium]